MTPEFAQRVARIEENLSTVIRGKAECIHIVLTAMMAGGHTLLEDVPGTGKTTLAKSIARSIDGIFRRVQFTPDLLPADITGSSYYNPRDGVFEYREGPVFCNVLLADEINRTSPRTQSALLEVMSENQITVDGKRRDLPQPFFVIATQNPTEFHGTYPLPEAQLDRFMVRVTMGYPSPEEEIEVLYSQNDVHPFESLRPVLTCQDVLSLQADVKTVNVDRAVAEYMIRIITAARGDSRVKLSISPRGSLALYRTSQARAALAGRAFVLPEDVRALVKPVLAHRITLDTRARYSGVTAEQVLEEALASVAVPR
jgi:MoxR-like ATPase